MKEASEHGGVLVVDDEAEVRGFLARVLKRNGYVCRTSAGAEEALEEAEQRPPALVLTDMRMPGRDGKWLLGELKSRWPEMAVIVLTADTEAKTAVGCLKAGADDYLLKPIDLDELLVAVHRATERARLLNETREQRHHLDIVQGQRARLQEALSVIETTYQDTIVSLLGTERTESSETSRGGAARSAVPSVPDSPEAVEPARMEDVSALRVAGKLIGEGAPYLEVGAAIARELVDNGGLLCARVWSKRKRSEDGLEAAVDVGSAAVAGLPEARRAITSGELECTETDGATSVVYPILWRGVAEGALQLVWAAKRSADMSSFTERLALVLTASLAREHDARERRRFAQELDLLYQVASASRYSLDLEHVAEFLLSSLHRILDFDVVALLLLDDEASLAIQTRFPVDDGITRRVREHILNNLKLTCGVEAPADLRIRSTTIEAGEAPAGPFKLRSFVNVPLTVGGGVVGLVHVSSGWEHGLSEGDVQVVHRAANFLASSVQGVRELVATLKGRIERMVDHMTDGVLMLDRRGAVVAMNEAARAALRHEDARGEPMTAARLAKVLDVDPLEAVAAERRSLRKLVCLRGVPYQVQFSPVLDDEAAITGAVVSFRNFEEEQKIDEMKSELINVVSHELRTPLTAVKIAMTLLRGNRIGSLTEKQEHFLALAQRNVEQLIGIVNDLLDLSKIEAGKMQVDLRPLSIREPLEDAASSLEPQAEEKKITVELSIEPDLPPIHGDRGSLQRVIVNLLGNAIKFTAREGRVSVTAAAEDGRDASSGDGAGTAVRVTVADSGEGIPEDQLESIFERFQQVSSESRHTTTPGTGLGLSISRELIKAHHGRIWAESTVGTGSRFSFQIPVLSDRELLARCLDGELARAREEGSSLALALIGFSRTEQLAADLREAALRRMLEHVRDAASRITRRPADRVFLRLDDARVVVSLPRTSREGGAAFEIRLHAELRENPPQAEGLELLLSTAIFPDDGSSPEELYARAASTAREVTFA